MVLVIVKEAENAFKVSTGSEGVTETLGKNVRIAAPPPSRVATPRTIGNNIPRFLVCLSFLDLTCALCFGINLFQT